MVFLILILCGTHRTWAAPTPVTSVVTSVAQTKTIFESLTYPARVESKVNAAIIAEADGFVTKVVPLGTAVTKGAPVFKLEHTDPVYQYAPLNLLAPVSGVVSQVKVTPGSLVSKGQELGSITDPRQLRIMIEVAATDLARLQVNMWGEFWLAGQTTPVRAKIKGLSPAIDPLTGTATCELTLDGAAKINLVPGLVGQIKFKVNEHPGILLPDYALTYKGDETFVKVVRDGQAHRIPVRIGAKHQGQVEILSGLKVGEQVIERASGFVAEGEKVQIEGPPAAEKKE